MYRIIEQISWAFRNISRGYYLGTTSDGMIQCNAKMPQSRAELWHVHLIPARGATMFALKSIGRKRFARTMPSLSGNYSLIISHTNNCRLEHTLITRKSLLFLLFNAQKTSFLSFLIKDLLLFI